MNKRADFNLETKRALAARAAYRCSFPGCPTVTVGPSDESAESTSETGMACHIVAASGGPAARRVVSTLSEPERCSIENGIWMCYKHGKLIDTDEHRFTIPMLKTWRKIAESRARYQQENDKDIAPQNDELLEIGFAPETVVLKCLGPENEIIGNALQDTCVQLIWGNGLANAARDVLIEITRNAFNHGCATECSITITDNEIIHTEDGLEFNCFGLQFHERGRGGSTAIRGLISSFGNKLLLGSRRENSGSRDVNRTVFALASLANIDLVKPCGVFLKPRDMEAIKQGTFPARLFNPDVASCYVVYVVLPNFPAPSDAINLFETMPADAMKGKQLVFVGRNVSSLVEQHPSFFAALRRDEPG